ncbi:HNH endonuclease signature motif containing protein [Herbiconiux sp. YIM B11900]|uniref:HNH endonuclease signature motif containing protein n=1 Tax=Herbiconiux sp. YIM B11900 TaxID=3404131 RepID=UPI003F87CC7E
MSKVDESPEGCWISRYSTGSHGYSQIGWQEGGKTHMVLGHRAAWTFAFGQVPLGMTIDHTCKTRRCVNPLHLRLLPNYENARRVFGEDWALGYCKRGHPSSELREYPRNGRMSKECRICRSERYARNNWRVRHPGEPFPGRANPTPNNSTENRTP